MTLQPEEKLREALAKIVDSRPVIWEGFSGDGRARVRAFAKADKIIALFASYRPDGVGGEHIDGDVQYLTAALSWYDGGPASADVRAAWSRIKERLAGIKDECCDTPEHCMFGCRRLAALPVEGGADQSELHKALDRLGCPTVDDENNPDGAPLLSVLGRIHAHAEHINGLLMGRANELKSTQVTEDDLAWLEWMFSRGPWQPHFVGVPDSERKDRILSALNKKGTDT